MTVEALWQAFVDKYPVYKDRSYEAWAFGGSRKQKDHLADLVLRGVKTATTSAYPLYDLEGERISDVGCLDIILDGSGQAICIIETRRVYLCRFDRVQAHHAYLEGEGDRSLAYWQAVHQDFFTDEMAAQGLEFSRDSLMVCEEFVCLYPKPIKS